MGRHTGSDPVLRSNAGAPRYVRALRLRHIHLGSVGSFLLFEVSAGITVLVALAGFTTWWAVPVIPALVAAMVKLNDIVAGRLLTFAAPPQPRRRASAGSRPSPRRRAVQRPIAGDGMADYRPSGGAPVRSGSTRPKPAPLTLSPGRCAVPPGAAARQGAPASPTIGSPSGPHAGTDVPPPVAARPAGTDRSAAGHRPNLTGAATPRQAGTVGHTATGGRRGARQAGRSRAVERRGGADLPAEATGEELVHFFTQMRQRADTEGLANGADPDAVRSGRQGRQAGAVEVRQHRSGRAERRRRSH